MKTTYVITAALCGLSLSTHLVFGQGSLTPPPGPPAPTMKTLDQIEPRTPITNVSYTCVITQPGSYYFTTNLTGVAPNGINIMANGVTIDLMGFELAGAPGNGGFGITVSGMRTNITIRNGTVRGWAGDGVHLTAAKNCVLQNLRVTKNSWSGLAVGDGSVVSSCVASFNGSHGITAGSASVVRDCSAMYNGTNGIRAGPSSAVTGCSAFFNKGHGITDDFGGYQEPGLSIADCAAAENGQDGFLLNNGSVVKNCLSRGNLRHGIETVNGTTITDCSANANFGTGIVLQQECAVNGCTASYNSTNGIELVRRCTITGCTVVLNYANGIHVTANGNRLDGNDVRDNLNDGISIDATATKNVVIRNVSGGNLNFQYRVPGIPGQPPVGANVVGPIVTDAATANAWANFSP